MNALTLESLKTILGREVQEVTLTVAKSEVFGLDSSTIAQTLGVSKEEVDELMRSSEYKDVRLLVGAEHQKEKIETDSNWDGLETAALRKLSKRVTIETDTEVLLKIAAVSNRAQRRTNPVREMSPLDAGSAGRRVPLTLTKRYTEKLQQGLVVERTETQQISVLDGSAVNPSFDEVQGALREAASAGGTASALPTRQDRAKSLADSIAKGFLDADQP